LLFRAAEAENPTILLMIDRNELEDQMLKNLAALGLANLEHASSIARLNKLWAQKQSHPCLLSNGCLDFFHGCLDFFSWTFFEDEIEWVSCFFGVFLYFILPIAQDDAWNEIEQSLRQFEKDGQFVGPCEMLVASGVK